MSDGLALWTQRDRFDNLEPEVLLPAQYADLCRNAHARPPELRLRLAVLEDAVRCYQHSLNGTRPSVRQLFSETAEWFAADEPQEPFSFVTICAVLGIDADCFRAGLSRWATNPAERSGARAQPVPGRRPASHRRAANGNVAKQLPRRLVS